ncbi:MAG: type II secretion system F family protein [Desulfatiglandales bacterium]
MSLSFITLFSFLAATSLIIIIFMLAMASQTSPEARIRRRLIAIGRNPDATQAQIQGLLKDSAYSQVPWFNVLLTRLNFVRGLDNLFERANLDMSVGLFLLLSMLLGGIIFLTLTLFGQPFAVAFLVGMIALSGPCFYAKYLARKRLRLFLEQMPDGLAGISQGLEAGMGLSQALVTVTKDMPDPFGTEFTIFMEEMNLGLSMTDALKNLQERMPLPEVRLFNNALVVQRETGGSLAEVLNKLADVIRDRFRIERVIKTLTAQNRLSAWVVSCTPVVLAAVMYGFNPALMEEVVRDPVGRNMMIAAVILEVIGILTFRKLLRIHI